MPRSGTVRAGDPGTGRSSTSGVIDYRWPLAAQQYSRIFLRKSTNHTTGVAMTDSERLLLILSVHRSSDHLSVYQSESHGSSRERN